MERILSISLLGSNRLYRSRRVRGVDLDADVEHDPLDKADEGKVARDLVVQEYLGRVMARCRKCDDIAD